MMSSEEDRVRQLLFGDAKVEQSVAPEPSEFQKWRETYPLECVLDPPVDSESKLACFVFIWEDINIRCGKCRTAWIRWKTENPPPTTLENWRPWAESALAEIAANSWH